MIGNSVASLVGVTLLSSLQHLCAHGTACADVYTFIRTPLKLLVVLSFGSSPFAFSLLHLCCLATDFRWGSFQVLAPLSCTAGRIVVTARHRRSFG